MTPCNMVDMCQCIWETCCLHFRDRSVNVFFYPVHRGSKFIHEVHTISPSITQCSLFMKMPFYFIVYLITLLLSQIIGLYSAEWLDENQLCIGKDMEGNSRGLIYWIPAFPWKHWRKPNHSQDSLLSARDSKWVPSKCKSEELLIKPTFLV
jgi:hypothetical protein